MWAEHEIMQLDNNLASIVRMEQTRRLWLRGRADWFQSREYCLNIEAIAFELWRMTRDESDYFGAASNFAKEQLEW
jgi:hypothetical protein